MNDDKLTTELKELLFFSIERIVMIKAHLDRIKGSILRRSKSGQQIVSYENSLIRIYSGVVKNTNDCILGINENVSKTALDNLYKLFQALKFFQRSLSLLPKEDAPIELRRFLRIFHQDGLSGSDDEKRDIKHVLYLGERETSSIFASSPLEEFESEHIFPIIGQQSSDVENENIYHMIVPRIESDAPLYWPSLAHEIAHQTMDLVYFDSLDINQGWTEWHGPLCDDAFSKSFRNVVKAIGSDASENDIIESWLTECWCDLYAYFAVGPSFIFAQKGAFLFAHESENLIGNEKHPAVYLRLMLLYQFLKQHQNELLKRYDILSNLPISYPSNKFLPIDENLKMDLNVIASNFYEYFKHYFDLDQERNHELHDHINKLKNNSIIYDPDVFDRLIDRLSLNYPVPSLRLECIEESVTLAERETSVQEVMLAAWLSYENGIKKNVVETIFRERNALIEYDEDTLWDHFKNKIIPNFEKFNESVLRSLQIGEWVKLYKPEPPSIQAKSSLEATPNYCLSCHDCNFSLLVDHEIKELISKDFLKIIPLVDISTQLSSCSLDIRLGTSFQTYQSNQSGVVDLQDEESVENVFKNSSDIDLDFMESIVLAPGQFALAHTMEYIGLPENIAAQIEGRSSFARLGLQVHMTANLIDPGFHGSVTFEIFNAGPNPIRLYPGYRIGQIRFFQNKIPLEPYNKKKTAKFKGMFIHASSLTEKQDVEVKRIMERLKSTNR